MSHLEHLKLTEEEILIISEQLNQTNAVELLSKFSRMTTKTDKDNYIKHRVFVTLSEISGISYDRIQESHDLKQDLGLTKYHKRALKKPFQKIVNDLGSQKRINVSECEKLKKVAECIALVKSKV